MVMTYAEIIKSLEVCQGRYSGYCCERCHLLGEHDCIGTLIKEALALIKRQRNRVNKLVGYLEEAHKDNETLEEKLAELKGGGGDA